MHSVLIGNGINIEFSGAEYLNKNIIKRAINTVLSGAFETDDYPQEILEWLYKLYEIFPDVLKGKFDNFTYATFERNSLKDLKRRYNLNEDYEIYQVGIEDYFLIHDLFCYKHGIQNPNNFMFRVCLKRLFLDAIYNSGKTQNIHSKYPGNLVRFLENHDYIFTTNYDNNLDNVVSKEIHHLHGDFNVLSETYDLNSFRNQISDKPGEGFNITEKNKHLYSNAIISYAGDLKVFAIKQFSRANSTMEAFADGIESDSNLKQEIEKWKDSNNELIRRMYEGVMLKRDNPELKFKETPSQDILEGINGTLRFIGLSPNNDIHLFSSIIDNENIDKIEFYYFDENEIKEVENIFRKKEIVTLPVHEFWKSMRYTV